MQLLSVFAPWLDEMCSDPPVDNHKALNWKWFLFGCTEIQSTGRKSMWCKRVCISWHFAIPHVCLGCNLCPSGNDQGTSTMFVMSVSCETCQRSTLWFSIRLGAKFNILKMKGERFHHANDDLYRFIDKLCKKCHKTKSARTAQVVILGKTVRQLQQGTSIISACFV